MDAIPTRFLLHPVYAPALGFGAGYAPRAPGTAGTLVGVPAYLVLQHLAWPVYGLIVAALFGIGIWLCGLTARALGVHDHPAIVWDEIVGYLATLWLAPPGWLWIVVGFFAFRLFDIWKPWPIHNLERRVPGGLGIMLDDLLAAVYGWIFIQLIHILYIVSLSSQN